MVFWLHYLRTFYRPHTLLCKYLPKIKTIDFVSTSEFSKINANIAERFDKFNVTKESISSSKLERIERPPLF